MNRHSVRRLREQLENHFFSEYESELDRAIEVELAKMTPAEQERVLAEFARENGLVL